MPELTHADATIYYEEHGQGFPILCFAPAGLLSTIEVWSRPSAPINPIADFSDAYRVIVMDQRNAGGRSHAPITANDGWHSFAADHLAILDELGIEQCHLYGQCIGGPFIMSLLKAQPQRFAAAVIAQTIGREGPAQVGRSGSFEGWVETLSADAHPGDAVLDAYYENLYGPDFTYSVDRDFARSCQTPCLVLAGNDAAHPHAVSVELDQLLPRSEFIEEWKDGEALVAAKGRIRQFLAEHTPVKA